MDQSDVSICKLSISKCKHIHELFNFTTKNDKNIDSLLMLPATLYETVHISSSQASFAA